MFPDCSQNHKQKEAILIKFNNITIELHTTLQSTELV